MSTPAAPTDPETFFSSYLPAQIGQLEAELHGVSSVASVTFRVLDAGEWSLRLADGRLEMLRGMEDDVMLQITVPREDFGVLVAGAIDRVDVTRVSGTLGPFRALAAKPDVARMVRHVPGSVLFVARDGELRHRLLVTPGRRVANVASAECAIEVALGDLVDKDGKGVPPMQLFVAGKLRITGNVQIAMALAAIFG